MPPKRCPGELAAWLSGREHKKALVYLDETVCMVRWHNGLHNRR